MSDQSATETILFPDTIQMDQGRMILHAAENYPSDAEALAQCPENGIEAGATQIVIELYWNDGRPLIIYTDNGSGLLDRMKSADRSLADAWMKGGREVPWAVMLQQLAWSSKQSLEAMLRYIARSRKPQDGTARGQKAIGVLAYLQFADAAKLITRPSPGLQADAGLSLAEEECFIVELPSRAQLESNRLGFPEIKRELKRPLKAVGFKPVHGTQLVISDLHEGVERSLSPRALVEFLGSRFGSDIRDKGVTITVIDGFSTEGRKTSGGITLRAEPPVYRGACLIDREVQTTHGKMRFRAKLYYLIGTRSGRSPKLRRLGSDLRPLSELPEELFRNWPWNAVEGFVEAPKEMGWIAGKTTPLQSSRAYLHWMAALRNLTVELEEQIRAQEKRTREISTSKFGSEVATSVLEAMTQVETFKHQPIGILPRAGKPKRKNQPRGLRSLGLVVDRDVEVAVVDENEEAVAEVTIELHQGDKTQGDTTKLLQTKITGGGGFVNFGEQPKNRRYTVMVTDVPYGCAKTEATEHGFGLNKLEEPGHRHIFHVRTFRKPKGKIKKLDRRFQVWIHEFEDADPEKVLFKERLPNVIEINLAFKRFAMAWDDHDWDKVYLLVAYGCAAAIAGWSLAGQGLDSVLQSSGQLFPVIYETLAAAHRHGRKRQRRT